MDENIFNLFFGLFIGVILTFSVVMVQNHWQNEKRLELSIDECAFEVSRVWDKPLGYSRLFCESTMRGDSMIGESTLLEHNDEGGRRREDLKKLKKGGGNNG